MCNSPDRNDRLMQRLLATTLFILCILFFCILLHTHFSYQLYWCKVGVTSLQQTEILLIYIIQLIINVPLSVASYRFLHVTNIPNYSSIKEDCTYTTSKLFSFCHFQSVKGTSGRLTRHSHGSKYYLNLISP